MNNFTYVTRSLFKKRNNTFLKVVSLGAGLAVGIVLLSKVYFETTFENFYPDKERIYHILSNYTQDSNSEKWGQVGGAVAPGMRQEIPGVETATRYRSLWIKEFKVGAEQKFIGVFLLGDSCMYDVIPAGMVAGDPKKILATPMQAIISDRIAGLIDGDPLGQTMELDEHPGKIVTITGIFKDLQANTAHRYDVVISMPSIGEFTWPTQDNWEGGDSFIGLVKLAPGVDPESLYGPMREMQKRHQNLEAEINAGIDFFYTLAPITKEHISDPGVKSQVRLLAMIALALIAAAVLNYILTVISSIGGRSREIAVYKCYGAGKGRIASLIFTETAVNMLLSLLFGVLLLLVFRGQVESLIQSPFTALFTPVSCLLMLLVVIVLLLLTGLAPVYLFARIPIANAFRVSRRSGKAWKLAMLFVQLIGVSFLFIFLVIVWRQYQVVTNEDRGYDYDKLVYLNTAGIPASEKQFLFQSLEQLPAVESTGLGSSNLLYSNGNVVYNSDWTEQLLSFRDLGSVDASYMQTMGINITEGEGFSRERSGEGDIMVNRLFAERLSEIMNWGDGIVGKTVNLSQHGVCTITGIYENLTVSISKVRPENPVTTYPSMMKYDENIQNMNMLMVKLAEVDGDNIRAVSDAAKAAVPDRDLTVYIYSDSLAGLYTVEKLFRNQMLVGSVITILILFMGLIGYMGNEIARRGHEIAIRKVNGASAAEVTAMLVRDIVMISVPAILLGSIAAYYISVKWMGSFATRASITIWLFLACSAAIFAIILLVTALKTIRIANQNPVVTLKTE